MTDDISIKALRIIRKSSEPMSTKELQERLMITRTKMFYRLNRLVVEGKIRGKYISSGKGVWVWWTKLE